MMARGAGARGDRVPAWLRGAARAPWFWPLAVFVAAFGLRLTYIAEVRFTPFFQTLGLDAKFYDQWARNILAGQGFPDAFFMTPLYSYFLAGIYWLFGRDLLVVRIIQAALGSLSAVLTYAIGVAAFNRRVGIASGLVTACYGAMIFYDGAILIEPLLVLFVTLSLYLVLVAERSRRPMLHLFLAGAALGVAAVGRAAALVLVPVAALWAAWGAYQGRRTRGAWAASLVILGVASVVTPVAIRNYVVSGDLVAITSNGGLNFYVGNSNISSGGYVKPEGLDIVADPEGRTIAEAAVGRSLRPSEVSSYWYGRAARFIAANPGRWLALTVRKASFAMSSYEIPQLENYYFQKRYSRLLSLPLPGFAVIAPLGLVGLAISFRRRRPLLLALYFVVYLLSVVAFFVVARYRLPVVPPLIVGACYAGSEFLDRLRARRWRAVVWPAVALGVLLIVVDANLWGVDRGKGFAQSHFRLGIILGDRGLIDKAIAEYRRSIEIDPAYPQSHLNLGALLADQGETSEAIASFRRALALDPGCTPARLNLAMALGRAGDYDAALAEADSALVAEPRNAAALKERGIILYRVGREDEAVAALEEAARRDTTGAESAEISFYLGTIQGRTGQALPAEAQFAMSRADSLKNAGRAVEAVALLERAAALAPVSGEPLRQLASLKRDMGLGEEALATMSRALQLEPTMAQGHFAMGILLSDLGRHDAAILEYEAETRIAPEFAPAHLNLAITYRFHRADPNRAAYYYRRYLALGGEPVPSMEELLRDLGTGLE
jgi:tetratricopeptide (TPR) repeat protein